MPLKLADINHSASTNVLNKWADGQERTQSTQATEISSLQNQVASLKTQASTAATTTPTTSTTTSTVLTVPGSTVGPFSTITFATGVPCNQTDIIGWSFQNVGPGAVYVVTAEPGFISGFWQVAVSTSNTSGGGSTSYGSYVINYKVL